MCVCACVPAIARTCDILYEIAAGGLVVIISFSAGSVCVFVCLRVRGRESAFVDLSAPATHVQCSRLALANIDGVCTIVYTP